jgi:threonine dehydrogenase-like Zn-dependent dehydrogenase
MRAVQFVRPGQIAVVDVPEPSITIEEVLLKIKYIGICGSDLSTYRGLNPLVNYPVIPGHEICAEVLEIGSGVPPHIHKGMMVTVNPYTHCGKCAACRRRRYNACTFNETMGVQRNGGMCEFVAVHWEKILINERLHSRELALVEPLSVGFHAVSRADLTDIDTVMVIGCGMIGMGAIVRSAMRGAKVIAVDLDDKKLEMAREMGAQYTVNSAMENVHGRLQELTHGLGPDVVIEAVGSPVTYVMAVDEVAFTGRVVYIGYAKEGVTFSTKKFVQKELDIRGSRNALPEDFVAVMSFMEKRAAPLEALITKELKPQMVADAMGQWSENPGQVFKLFVDFNS